MHWKSLSSPTVKKARMSKSKFKVIMIVFFDIYGIVHLHWVLEGQTVNQHYFLRVLVELRERIRKNDPNCGRTSYRFSTKKMRRPILHCLSRGFQPSPASQCLTIRLIRQMLRRATSVYFLKWNLHLKNKIRVRWSCERKSGTPFEGADRKRLPALFQTMKDPYGAL